MVRCEEKQVTTPLVLLTTVLMPRSCHDDVLSFQKLHASVWESATFVEVDVTLNDTLPNNVALIRVKSTIKLPGRNGRLPLPTKRRPSLKTEKTAETEVPWAKAAGSL